MGTKRKAKLARTFLGASLLVLIGAGFSTISSASEKSDVVISSSESKYVQVVVTPGESLWSIAAMVAGNSQIQSVVADIVEVNKLKSADVPAGTRLLVPTF